ncbi:MAG: DUF3341 domain-containing protein [Phycisphaerae bacterium]
MQTSGVSTIERPGVAAPRTDGKLHALLAEFDSPQTLISACERVRDAGFSRWDAHSPYPIHGIDEAMGIRMTRLPYLVFVLGLTGCLTGIGLQWWANAADARQFGFVPTFLQGYNFPVSGKPFWSFPANIPVIFELTILFSALAAFIGMLAMNNLPLFSRPVFRSRAFTERVTSHGFFVCIEAADPKFNEARARTFLESIGALGVERVEDHDEAPLRNAWIKRGAVIAFMVLLIPPAMIAKAWTSKSNDPRVHIIQDMDNQEKYKAQQSMPLFADRRAARQPLPGTVARGDLRSDDHLYRGIVGEQFADDFPASVLVNESLIRRGQQRFGVYCAPCHGLDGSGNGPVNVRAMELGGSWVAAADLADDERRSRPAGHLYNTITNGIRTMPAYGDRIKPEDRWAIVAYVRALQHARHADADALPPDLVEQLKDR